ncbi:hypothetical protein QCQ60_004961 [Bacillus cereus]|nr:hypothetical protein [Bacillus cereus]
MKIHPQKLYLSKERQIGLTIEDSDMESTLFKPSIAQYMQDGSIFIVDLKLSHLLKRFNKIKYIKNKNCFLAVDKINEDLVKLNCKMDFLWKFPSNKFNIKPVCFDVLSSGDLAVIDANTNKILRVRKNGSFDVLDTSKIRMKEPISIQCLDNDNILIVDCELHIVFEITIQGELKWIYGTSEVPGKNFNQLAYPSSASRLENGNTLIADSMNYRVIEVNDRGNIIWEYGKKSNGTISSENKLYWPVWVDRNDDKTLITDQRNNRVIEVNHSEEIKRQIGNTPVIERAFSFPRSIQLLSNDEFLIADTSNNRVVQITKYGEIIWYHGTGEQGNSNHQLFWPRSAQRLQDGNTLIADGRNKRIIIVNQLGALIREINTCYYQGQPYKLGDPHYTRMLENGNILIVDALNNDVLEISKDDEIKWIFNPKNKKFTLNDPHFVAINRDQYMLIADSGNNRIVMTDKEQNTFWECNKLVLGDREIGLYYPRLCGFTPDNLIMLLDGGTGYIFIINKEKEIIRFYEPVDEEVRLALKKARSIQFKSSKELYVSDIYESCILKLWVKKRGN